MNIVILALCGMLLLSAVRLFIGPTIHDRLISLNVASGLAVSLMAAVSLHFGRSLYLDVALIYAALSFIGVIAIAKFLRGASQESGDAGPKPISTEAGDE